MRLRVEICTNSLRWWVQELELGPEGERLGPVLLIGEPHWERPEPMWMEDHGEITGHWSEMKPLIGVLLIQATHLRVLNMDMEPAHRVFSHVLGQLDLSATLAEVQANTRAQRQARLQVAMEEIQVPADERSTESPPRLVPEPSPRPPFPGTYPIPQPRSAESLEPVLVRLRGLGMELPDEPGPDLLLAVELYGQGVDVMNQLPRSILGMTPDQLQALGPLLEELSGLVARARRVRSDDPAVQPVVIRLCAEARQLRGALINSAHSEIMSH